MAGILIDLKTLPQPCEYTLACPLMPLKLCSIRQTSDSGKFTSFLVSTLIGTGLYCLVATNSLSRSLQHRRPINGRKTSSSFALGVRVNMSAKFCVQGIFNSHLSQRRSQSRLGTRMTQSVPSATMKRQLSMKMRQVSKKKNANDGAAAAKNIYLKKMMRLL